MEFENLKQLRSADGSEKPHYKVIKKVRSEVNWIQSELELEMM